MRTVSVLLRAVSCHNFAIDPTGSYLFAANELSGNVAVFKIDTLTGRLSPTKTDLKIDVPVCIVFLPAGK